MQLQTVGTLPCRIRSRPVDRSTSEDIAPVASIVTVRCWFDSTTRSASARTSTGWGASRGASGAEPSAGALTAQRHGAGRQRLAGTTRSGSDLRGYLDDLVACAGRGVQHQRTARSDRSAQMGRRIADQRLELLGHLGVGLFGLAMDPADRAAREDVVELQQQHGLPDRSSSSAG